MKLPAKKVSLIYQGVPQGILEVPSHWPDWRIVEFAADHFGFHQLSLVKEIS